MAGLGCGSCSVVGGTDYGHLYGACASISIYSPVGVGIWVRVNGG